MNITLRCRGSKREQARPPICAAGRRAHRRAGCRGDQSNAALNARVRPNRQHSYRCRGSCSCRPQPSRRRTTSSRHQRFFLSVVGELGFHYNAVERALLVERGRRGRVEAVRAVVAAGAVSQPMSAAPRSVCCRKIGTPSSLDVQQIADQRIWRRSRARATESPPEIVPAPGISSQSQVRFRSGHCGDWNGMVPALLPGSLLFILAS